MDPQVRLTDKPLNFFAELGRRRVLPIAGAYIAIAWLVTEIASFLMVQIGAPAWGTRLLAIVFIVGFPIAVILAWTIQVGPDGKRSLDPSTGQGKTVIGAVILGIVATAGLSWLILPRVPDVPDYQPIPNSIAILPFADDATTPNARTAAETLLAALEEGLGQSRQLNQVTLTFDETPADMAAFGREYKVAALLLGHVVQGAGGLRIEMELLDVGDETVHWSTAVDWDPTRIRETGTSIANGVLESMGLETISEKEFAGTNNREAYDALLDGFTKQGGFAAADQLIAIESFQRAIDLDPGYVEAYVGLAQTIWIYLFSGPPEDEREAWLNRARAAIDIALQLDDESADAVSMAGMWEENPELQKQAYRRALALEPDHAMSYFRLGHVVWREGDLAETERLFRESLDYHPFSGNIRGDLAWLLWTQQRREQAIVEINRAIAANPRQGDNYLILATMLEDNPPEKIKALRSGFELDPARGASAATIGMAYASIGAKEEAIAWARHATEISPTDPFAWIWAMFALLDVGETQAGIAYAEQTLRLAPNNRWALRELGALQIAAGETDLVLKRWQDAYPSIAVRDHAMIDTSNVIAAVDFASNLIAAGQTEWANELLNESLEHLQDKPAYLRFAKELREQGHSDFSDSPPGSKELDVEVMLQRVRDMECNGEMPPAPGAGFTPTCP